MDYSTANGSHHALSGPGLSVTDFANQSMSTTGAGFMDNSIFAFGGRSAISVGPGPAASVGTSVSRVPAAFSALDGTFSGAAKTLPPPPPSCSPNSNAAQAPSTAPLPPTSVAAVTGSASSSSTAKQTQKAMPTQRMSPVRGSTQAKQAGKPGEVAAAAVLAVTIPATTDGKSKSTAWQPKQVPPSPQPPAKTGNKKAAPALTPPKPPASPHRPSMKRPSVLGPSPSSPSDTNTDSTSHHPSTEEDVFGGYEYYGSFEDVFGALDSSVMPPTPLHNVRLANSTSGNHRTLTNLSVPVLAATSPVLPQRPGAASVSESPIKGLGHLKATPGGSPGTRRMSSMNGSASTHAVSDKSTSKVVPTTTTKGSITAKQPSRSPTSSVGNASGTSTTASRPALPPIKSPAIGGAQKGGSSAVSRPTVVSTVKGPSTRTAGATATASQSSPAVTVPSQTSTSRTSTVPRTTPTKTSDVS